MYGDAVAASGPKAIDVRRLGSFKHCQFPRSHGREFQCIVW